MINSLKNLTKIHKTTITKTFHVWHQNESFSDKYNRANKLIDALKAPIRTVQTSFVKIKKRSKQITIAKRLPRFLAKNTKRILNVWRRNATYITKTTIRKRKLLIMLQKVAQSKPQRYLSKWKRATSTKTRHLTEIFNKMNVSIINKQHTVIKRLHEKVRADQIAKTNASWRWRVINLSGVMENIFSAKVKRFETTINMERTFNTTVKRSMRYFIEQIRPVSTPVASAWKFLVRAARLNLAKALLQWKANYFEEMALDYSVKIEDCEMTHPLYTNFAKVVARANIRDLTNAFKMWAFDAKKPVIAGLLRWKRITDRNMKQYLAHWRIITNAAINKRKALLLHKISCRLGVTAMNSVGLAFRQWVDPTNRNLAHRALLLFAKKLEHRLSVYFNLWCKNSNAKHYQQLANLAEGAKILHEMIRHRDQSDLAARMTRWHDDENRSRVRAVLARLVSNCE